MAIAPLENFRGFMQARSPLVLFMIILGVFAVILLSISYYVNTHEVQNPDITQQDWNAFLNSFAELDFCVLTDATDLTTPFPVPITRPAIVKVDASATTPPPTELDGSRNYSVSMLLTIQPTQMFISIPHNITRLTGTVYGYQFGLAGLLANEQINVSVSLAHEWNTTHCTMTGYCDPVKMVTCVQLTATSLVFPISRNPPVCEGLNETGIDYNARVSAFRPHPQQPSYYCRSRPVIHVRHLMDPSLTVWLSLHDRSIINLHLLHTSYFLFVMVVTLFGYAIFRGHKSKFIVADKAYQAAHLQSL